MKFRSEEEWRESQKSDLEQDILGHIVADENISSHFLAFIDEYLGHIEKRGSCEGLMERILNAWLKTTQGKEWFENVLQNMIHNRPEDDDRE